MNEVKSGKKIRFDRFHKFKRKKYDEKIGEKGHKISTGQRQ